MPRINLLPWREEQRKHRRGDHDIRSVASTTCVTSRPSSSLSRASASMTSASSPACAR